MKDNAVVRSYTINMEAPYRLPESAGSWDRLIYASRGVMSVHTAGGTWVVPPQRTVWVPSGLRHSVELHGNVYMRTLHLRQTLKTPLPAGCCVLNVTPFLRELMLHIVENCPMNRGVAFHSRLVAVLLEQLRAAPAAPLELPTLTDPRAAKVAALLRTNPSDERTLEQLAAEAGASARTVERLFRREAGLTFAHWRRQCRLLCAMQLLAAGEPVSNVALRVGYETPSAFIAMFRTATATTPGTYFNNPP